MNNFSNSPQVSDDIFQYLYWPDFSSDSSSAISILFWILMLICFIPALFYLCKILLFYFSISNQINKLLKESFNYNDFEQKLTDKKILNDIFKDFKNTINQDIHKMNYLSSQSESFLNDLDAFNVLFNYGNYPGLILKYIPSFYTSLGILGTFVGIVVGLSSLTISSNANVLQDSISRLVSGAALSFKTSLWGLTISIFYSLFYNFFINIIEMKVKDFKNILKYRLGLKTRENYEVSQQTKLLEEIKGSQEKLATDIADAFQNNVTQQILPGLTVKFDQLSEGFNTLENSIKQNFENLNKDFTMAIIKNSKDIRDSLSYNFSNFIEHEKNADAKLYDALESQHETLKSSHKQVTELLDNTTKKQEEAFEIQKMALQTTQGQFKELMENIVNSQKDFFKTQKQAVNDAQKQTSEIFKEKISSQIQQDMSGLQSMLTQVTESMNSVLDKSDESMKNSNTLIQDMISQWQQSMHHQKELNSNAVDMTQNLNTIAVSINQVMERLSKTASDIDNNILHSVSNVNSQVGEITDRINTFTMKQQESINEQRDTIVLLNDTINKTLIITEKQQNAQLIITGELHKLDEKLAAVSKHYSGIAENFKYFTDVLIGFNQNFVTSLSVYKDYHKFINTTIVDNSKVLYSIISEIKSVLEDIDENIVEKTAETTNKLQLVSEKIGHLINTYDKFAQAEKESQEVWKTYKDNFNEMNEQIKKAITSYTESFNNQVTNTIKDYDHSIGTAMSDLSSIVSRLNDSVSEFSSIYADKR